jgi:autotransporter-associated beta strand protein
VLTIGSAGNAGIVALNSFAVGFSAVNVVNGTAVLETSDDRIDPDTPVTLGSSLGSATLDINGLSQTLSELTFAGSGSEVTGGTLRLDDSPTVTVAGTGHEILSDVVLDDDATFSLTGTGDLTVSGDVSGSGGIIKEGVGTLTFSGANTYTGTTTINSGTFVLSGTLAATSQVFIGSATLECTGSTKSANAVEITGTATQKGSMTVDTLSGSGSLTHDGGTLTLTNASTLTGTLTVASGSLVLNAIVSGSGVTSATFTPSALTVDFSSAPSSGDQFVLLNGPTGGAYGTVTLTNAGGATGTYNSSTSTLTIN